MPAYTDLRVDQLDDEARTWLRDVLDDVELVLADGTALRGPDAVRDALAEAWKPIASLTKALDR